MLNDQKQVVGMIDDKDCLNVLFGSAYYNYPVGSDTVASYMSSVMKFITVNDTIVGAANIFLQTTYKRLIILDDEGYLAGQISRRDILRAIKDLKKNTW
ncbi:MAG: CBS domain-containing protein [Saprospiraceae bacterium]|nr:CBS domain-containing protein [Saprospiraceae bacterium]